MKIILISSVVVLCLFLLAGCCSKFGHKTADCRITQFSTIDSLLAGNFDGVVTVKELRRSGTLGLGTIDHLDGEMIVLDGAVYHVRSDGKSRMVPDHATIPFATVVNFKAEKVSDIGKCAGMDDFAKQMETIQPNKNLPVAICMYGKFTMMKTRSVPRQEKPYPTLLQVTQHQSEFFMQNVEGWLVGFRMPAYIRGINASGWHLHFLSADKKAGGHVLAFRLESGRLESIAVHDFRMILPQDSEAFMATDLSLDRSLELHKAESDH